MGEMAEYLLNGDDDYITGEYIGQGNGYPRTFHDAKKYTGEGSVRNSIRIVTEHFGKEMCQELQNGGLNVKLPNNGGTVTIWFKKAKWTHSKRPNLWFYFKNAPKEHPYEIIAQIEGLMGKEDKSMAENKPLLVQLANHQGVGVQECITHIQNKILTVENNNPNNAVLTVLKALVNELEQYL